MNEYPDWDDNKTPHTDTKAKVVKTRYVTNASVISVVGGKYRSATLDGVFELVDAQMTKLSSRVLVRCSWFGVTPPTTYPQLDISNATVVKRPNYTGAVADDIGL